MRRLYDPQYVLGELDEIWQEHLRRYNRTFREIARSREYTQRIATEQEALDEYLGAHSVAKANDTEARRALRIAAHVNREGLKDLIHNGLPSPGYRQRVLEVINRVIDDKTQYTCKLLAVQTHHELTRIELDDYNYYVRQILN